MTDLFGIMRLGVYQRLFDSVKEREGSLSATEAFCVDIVHLLGDPTLTQFASVLHLSQPNATYKINSLAAKGYVIKEASDTDRREIRIRTTEKFARYFTEEYGLKNAAEKLSKEYTKEELELVEKVMKSLKQHLLEE